MSFDDVWCHGSTILIIILDSFTTLQIPRISAIQSLSPLQKTIYTLNAITTKIPKAFFCRNRKIHSKIHMDLKKPKNSSRKTMLHKWYLLLFIRSKSLDMSAHCILLSKSKEGLSMVFPVVMYGCENWTIKMAEHQILMFLNCGAREDSWESLGLQDQDSQS